jgi:DNA-binding beta-propeller fold protein YncE
METVPYANNGRNSGGGGGGLLFTAIFLIAAAVALYYLYGALYSSTGVDSVMLVKGKQSADTSPTGLPTAPVPFEGGEYTFNTWFYVNSYNKNRNSRKHLFELRGKYFSTLVVALGAFRNTLTIRTHTRDATENFVGGFEGFQNAAVPAEVLAVPPPSGGGWKGFEGFSNFGQKFLEFFQAADLATNYAFTVRKLNVGTARVANFVTKGSSSSGPFGIVADGTGNVYVSDVDNHVIRKFTSDGTATILAGIGSSGFKDQALPQGASTIVTIDSQFNRPMGLALTGENLYVADTGNNRIRVINVRTKATTTLAGTATPGSNDTTGSFNGPQGLALNTTGTELYVTDTENNKIRKITNLTGTPVVQTLAGNGAVGATDANSTTTLTTEGSFNRPTGIVVDDRTGVVKIYIADTGNHKIRLLDTGAARLQSIAGSGTAGFMDGTGANARFNSPKGLALDTLTNNLYIADSGNNRVRFIPTSGTVSASTLAGSNLSGNQNADSLITSTFKAPSGLAYKDGNLFIGDGADPTVASVPSATTTSTATTTTTTTGTPAGTLTTTTGGGLTTTTSGGTSSTTGGAMGGGSSQPATTAPPGVSGTDGTLNAGSMNAFFGTFAMDDDMMTALPACDLPEFDLQRWVMLTVVLNGRTIDVYMDGKLVRSCTTKSFYKVDPSGVRAVICDRGGFDGYISNAAVANYAMNPDQIYRTYLSGPEGGTLNIFSWLGGLFSGAAAK